MVLFIKFKYRLGREATPHRAILSLIDNYLLAECSSASRCKMVWGLYPWINVAICLFISTYLVFDISGEASKLHYDYPFVFVNTI